MTWNAAWERISYVWTHPANRGARWRALGRATAWQISKHTRGRPWNLTLYGSMRLRCYADSQSAVLALYTQGWADWHEMQFLRHFLRPGDGFLDVGANVGVYALLAAACVGPSGRIEAFEPGKIARERLLENVRLSRLNQVHIHPHAASSHAGRVRFVECGASSRIDALDRLPAPKDELLARPGTDSLDTDAEVECVVLDDVVAGHSFRAGKLDVEGAEPAVLAGATRMLAARNPPVWIVEMNGRLRDFGFREEQLAEWLGDHGYDLGLYDAESRRLDFGPRPWTVRENVLAVARDSMVEIQEWLAAAPGDSPPHGSASCTTQF